jgi:hypothetical protein
MRNIKILIRVVMLSLVILFVSCKKEVVYPTDQLPANVPHLDTASTVGGWGKFLIIDATMWVEDKETGVKTHYNHFSSTKSRSSLRWGGAIFDIETIIKDTTTYSFWKPTSYPGTGKFVLNDDTTKFYQVNYVGLYRTIIEDATHGQSNLGGSARPFSGITIDNVNQIVGITIQEMEGIDGNGHAIHYFTQLTLKKTLSW